MRALLQHGSYERYYFLLGMPYSVKGARARLEQYPNHERAEIVLVDDFAKLRPVSNMALFTPTALLYRLQHLRKCVGAPGWPVVGMTHALSHQQGLPYVLFSLFEELYKYDCLICTSRAAREAIANILDGWRDYLARKSGIDIDYPVQMPVIPLAVDATVYCSRNKSEARLSLNIARDCTMLLCLGRFSALLKMDLFLLILAFSETIAKKNEKVLLVLAGDDTQENLTPQLKSFSSDLGCAERVKVLPNITFGEKQLLYSAADIFVSPSDNVQETLGLTVIEAMASGPPVIASDWSGYRDTVEHGKVGFLVPTYWAGCVEQISRLAMARGDAGTHWLLSQSVCVDLESLGDYMTTLVDNELLRQRMGDAARQRVLNYYDWPVIVRLYEELWHELMMRAAGKSDDGNHVFRHGISSYDYLRVFGHYATAILTSNKTLAITASGRKYLERGLKVAPLELNALSYLPQLNYKILAACDSEQEIEVGCSLKK